LYALLFRFLLVQLTLTDNQCGAAPNSEALIVGRAVAGLGCAGIFSGALIILSLSVPVRNRPIYTGLIGGMFGRCSGGASFVDRG
jgi:MFS family permease